MQRLPVDLGMYATRRKNGFDLRSKDQSCGRAKIVQGLNPKPVAREVQRV